MTILARSGKEGASRLELFTTAPYVAVVVFALAMLTIVWMLQSQEEVVERSALGRDVQWAERTMRTHFLANEEFLNELAREIASDTLDSDAFQLRTNQYLANNPELINVVWIDASGKVRWSAPFDTTDWLPGDTLSATQGQVARHAREIGRAAYGQPYRGHSGSALVEVFIPVQRGRAPWGMIAAVYSVDGLLLHLVPSWFSEKYRLTLTDGNAETLASNAISTNATDPGLSSLIVFDPPGNGLALRATAYRGDTQLPNELPVSLIIGLSVLVFWSLWAQRGHMLRRIKVEKERDRIFNLSLDVLCTLNLNGNYRRLNPAIERILGYPAESMIGRPLLDLVHPEDLEGASEQMQLLARGRPATFEARMRCADGRYKWLVWSANPVPDERVIYAVAHNVTDRKAAEDAWRAESAFRRAMEESVLTGLRATDMKGRIIYVNRAFCELTGYSESELVGIDSPFPYWPDDEIDRNEHNLALSLAGEAPVDGFELRIKRKDGNIGFVRLMVSPLVDAAGQQTGWMAAMNDITESKRIHAELEAAHERFVAVLDGLDTAVFVADVQSDAILYANHAFLSDFGLDAVGRTTHSLALPQPELGDYPVDPRRLTPEQLPRELFDGELHHPLSARWFHVRERATRWVDGRVVRMAVATNITDRKTVEELNRQQEERLQRTSRLITMGEMASTLAHELNQPLSAIANYSSGCVNRLQSGRYKPEELLVAMQKAAHQADRAGKIIRRVRDFVRKSEPRRSAVRLFDVVEDALGFAEIDARKHGARIDNRVTADLPPIYADRIMVEQVVLNLVKNGIEAMKDSDEDRRILTVSARVAESMIEVSVIDHGHGISAEDREKLFNAFYTTKSDGMGMGLNICRSIIEFHNGRLWVDNNPEGGSIFRFTLPTENALEHLSEPV
ncbi:PAS domain S-box protein [Niveibacterium sp. 24ML]|uniref:PAS domain S-box protein n=1 Tax=Niveibacterium sp. 24ML TaxID=2985512 RepID=UPI0022707E7C|nr:PAS domain S-box protein [Niveibacterium sp. 24ML]MCX9155847.1 PAS domain S-box protein [Niveibacterium sp. 24ML]